VVNVFDDMLDRSIPNLAEMRQLTAAVALPFLRVDHPIVLDLGFSVGGATAALMEAVAAAKLPSVPSWIGLESEPAMIAEAQRRFGKRVWIIPKALPTELSIRVGTVSVVLAVLTLQFLPEVDRARVVHDSFARLRPGGAMLIVEKIGGDHPDVAAAMAGAYRAHKLRSGYTPEAIDAKDASLAGVMRPGRAGLVEAMLRDAGFSSVERYWQWLCFAGWVAVRPR
jgi:tRNA (cmo5U34)-methyltransferase